MGETPQRHARAREAKTMEERVNYVLEFIYARDWQPEDGAEMRAIWDLSARSVCSIVTEAARAWRRAVDMDAASAGLMAATDDIRRAARKIDKLDTALNSVRLEADLLGLIRQRVDQTTTAKVEHNLGALSSEEKRTLLTLQIKTCTDPAQRVELERALSAFSDNDD